MAPTSNGSARRGRGSNGSARRNAFTNAGVNRGRGQSRAPRGSHRARGNHRHRANHSGAHHHGQAASRPSLASRITYGDAGAQDQTINGRTDTSHHQSADDDDNIGFSIHGQATSRGSVNSYDSAQADHNTASAGAATANDFDAEEDVDIDIDIDDNSSLFNSQQDQDLNLNNFSQQSAFFCGSQPTQQATDLIPSLSPSPSPPTTSYTSNPPVTPSPSTPTSCRIRMLNQHPITTTPSSRPINTYRGKDPIKRRFQNKKLQAVLTDRPVPKERTKSGHEKMELRMGMRSASKRV